MSLRTRIALTFVLLLAGVLAAAFLAVSAANRANAQREIDRQLAVGNHVFERALESNRRQLVQAAQVLAADDSGWNGFADFGQHVVGENRRDAVGIDGDKADCTGIVDAADTLDDARCR